MALTKRLTTTTDSTSLENTLTRPDSVTVVTSGTNPSADSSFTTSSPKVLYTAPSDCKYVKIYWRKSNTNGSDVASYFPNSSTSGYYYGISIANDTITREIYRGSTHTYGQFSLNAFIDNGFNTPVLEENDTLVYTNANTGHFIISGAMFTLAPGEKLQVFTGSNNFTQSYIANFEAWVYN
jgi:hypothetical protein